MRVTAHQGDTVDLICHRHLGRTDLVEAVLEANPGIAALGPVLPMGTPLDLPDAIATTAPSKNIIRLWD